MSSSPPAEAAATKPQEYFPPDRPWEQHGDVTHLVGMRCSACGTKAFPARSVCAGCGTQDGLEPLRLSARGTLYTFSEVHAAPKDFPTPYVIGYVDLEDGVRIFGQIEGTAATLAPDQRVETTTGVVRTRANGAQVIGYKFRSIPA